MNYWFYLKWDKQMGKVHPTEITNSFSNGSMGWIVW